MLFRSRGALVKEDGNTVEAFDIFLGGNLGSGAGFGQRLNCRLREDDLLMAVHRFIKNYLDNRKDNETFHDFVMRVDLEVFRKLAEEKESRLDDMKV